MKDFKNIVVGVDFSECSVSALEQAARIAAENEAKLHVIHVIDSLGVADLIEATHSAHHQLCEVLIAELKLRLENLIAVLDHPFPTHVDVRVGLPIVEIFGKVQALSADLLVLGAHGESGGSNMTGSLATSCVRQVPCEVMLVRQSHAGAFKTIVAAVDFSDSSMMAVGQAIRMAAQDHAALKLVHIYNAPWHRLHCRAPTPQQSQDYMLEYLTILQTRMDGCRELFEEELAGLDVQCELRDSPSYAEGIVDYIKETSADLVVLGKRGRSNLSYVFLGSTAEKVIRNTSCSVLAVNPDMAERFVSRLKTRVPSKVKVG